MKLTRLLLFLMVIVFAALAGCNPEDEYLRKLYPKDTRTFAIQGLRRMKDDIVNLDKTCTKLLRLDKTPESGMAVLTAAEIGCVNHIDRIGEIADDAFTSLNTRNLKTLESIATALGILQEPEGVPILAKFFNINTPEQLAPGAREKPESVAKRSAIESLSKMPEASKHLVPKVMEVFDSKIEDFGTKYTTAGVIGEWRDPSTVKPLVVALFYEEQGFSLFPQARESLIKLGKQAEPELIHAYNGKNEKVNEIQDNHKKRATEKFCPEYMNEEVMKKEECPRHDEWFATLAQIDTTSKLKTSIILSDIRSKQAVDLVIAELEAQLATDKKQPFLAEHLAVQLGKFGDFKATDTLLKMVSKDFTKASVRKLGRGASKEEKMQVKLADRGQEISIVMKGAEALAVLGDPKAIPYLLKGAMDDPPSEYNMHNEKIVFYESTVWLADAFSRMVSNPEQAQKFIKHSEKFIADGEKYIETVEKNVRAYLLKEAKDEEKEEDDEEALDKKVKAQAKLDVNYESTVKAVEMFKRFAGRCKLAEECGTEMACYAKKLGDKEPVNVEKAVYMLGYSNEIHHYKDQLKPAFKHSEPWVREAVSVALLKTEDKGFVPILEEVVKEDGDKVEHALAMREFKAILSYLGSM
jgi:VCBS repeat-containing protein